MEINSMNLEVDGSFQNPYAVAAFAIWFGIVVVFAVLMGVRAAKRPATTRWLLVLGTALLLVPLTKLAHGLIATVLYNWPDGGVASVGLWGGPPILPAPLAALVAYLAARSFVRNRLLRRAV